MFLIKKIKINLKFEQFEIMFILNCGRQTNAQNLKIPYNFSEII